MDGRLSPVLLTRSKARSGLMAEPGLPAAQEKCSLLEETHASLPPGRRIAGRTGTVGEAIEFEGQSARELQIVRIAPINGLFGVIR